VVSVASACNTCFSACEMAIQFCIRKTGCDSVTLKPRVE